MPVRVPPHSPTFGDLVDIVRSVVVDDEAPDRYQTVPAQVVHPATVPDRVDFGGVLLYHFDPSSDEAISFSIQLPHQWKEGSAIRPFVMWAPTNTNTGTVRWQLEHRIAGLSAAYPSVSTLTADQAAAGNAVSHRAEFSALSMAGIKVGDVVLGTLSRLGSDGADTYTGDAALTFVGAVVLVDTSRGARGRWLKWGTIA